MPRRILVVDDLAQNRYMLRALLEGNGFQVDEARNGAEALEIARRDPPPDAVVTDLLMPEMDGFALSRAWMRDDRLWQIPFVVYTATYTQPEDRQLALDLGAAVFIRKPAEPEELVRALNDCLQRARPPTGPPPAELEDFFARYSRRLRQKLDRKLVQLAATEQSLVDYVTRCEAILDATPEAIIAFDGSCRLRAWNYAAEQLFGHTESEALDQPLTLLVPAELMPVTQERLAEVRARRRVVRFESRWHHKTGRVVDVAVSLSLLGPEIGFVAVLSDLSATHAAAEEKKRLERELMQAQRMESLGRLAGGVAHDFNNLLTIILSHAGFIETDLPGGHPLREDAQRIREAGERATALTRQLLAFSRRQTIVPEVIDLNETIRAMERMLPRLIGEDIELSVSLAPDLGATEADISQIEQVILNLAINARDAMPDGGKLVIETRNVVVDRTLAEARPPMRPGRYVLIVFRDAGVGMDEETRAHAFDPFFTTKDRGKGTGLGLSTVHGIVHQSNGFIWLTSEPGRGTTFEIHLPRVDSPVQPRHQDVRPQDVQGQGETILVVEDDDLVRKLARAIIERAGYQVVEATSPDEALRLAERGDVPIDVLLTDVIMPAMNGQELAKRILVRRPKVKVVFTSGYTDDVIAHHGVLDRGVSLVQKPFSASSLTAKVRAVLDGKEPGGVGTS